MNSTEKALLERGIDSKKAKELIKNGYNLETLAALNAEQKNALGFTENDIQKIFKNDRPKIPEDIVYDILFKCRNTCCICRDSSKSIIIHHIIEWNISKDNSENNLVVLCIEHHDMAHTKKELSRNLTSEEIKSSKAKWEKEVSRLDNEEVNLNRPKELSVFPIHNSNLKKRWFNFLKKLGWRIEILDDSVDKPKFDFKVYGKRELVFKVFEIDEISQLINKEFLVKESPNKSFFDNLIILGNKPFLSSKGYYGNELNIQIGWIFSYGEGDWDNVMLKDGYDISNSIFYVENFLYDKTSWKHFLTEADMLDVEKIWEESL